MCGGGNRSLRGAQTQHILASLLRTAQQRGLDTTETAVLDALSALHERRTDSGAQGSHRHLAGSHRPATTLAPTTDSRIAPTR